jgi:glycosyltransferase involved in cell wall biosynthesis
MRVLIASDYFLPRGGGGVERAIYEVAVRLTRMGHKVTVLTLDEIAQPLRDSVDGIPVWRVPGRDLTSSLGITTSFSRRAWSFFAELLDSAEFDVVNVHNIFFELSLVGALRTHSRRLPLVVTAHLGPVSELGLRYGLPSRLYEQTVGRFILSRADSVTAVSEAVARHVLSLGASGDRLTVVPNGVDAKRFKPAETLIQSKEVVFVGRLVFNKGPQFLVEAIPSVLAAVPQAHFTFVGDGPMLEQLKDRTRELGVENAADFLGRRGDVEDLLAPATVFARPSLLEGFSLTVLEAMACGVPVVATPVGGTAEVMCDGIHGYLVPPRDVDALADRIVAVLVDPNEASRMGQSGRNAVETSYSWDRAVEQLIGVFQDAARRFSTRE